MAKPPAMNGAGWAGTQLQYPLPPAIGSGLETVELLKCIGCLFGGQHFTLTTIIHSSTSSSHAERFCTAGVFHRL